jgi:hypothetical protein
MAGLCRRLSGRPVVPTRTGRRRRSTVRSLTFTAYPVITVGSCGRRAISGPRLHAANSDVPDGADRIRLQEPSARIASCTISAGRPSRRRAWRFTPRRAASRAGVVADASLKHGTVYRMQLDAAGMLVVGEPDGNQQQDGESVPGCGGAAGRPGALHRTDVGGSLQDESGRPAVESRTPARFSSFAAAIDPVTRGWERRAEMTLRTGCGWSPLVSSSGFGEPCRDAYGEPARNVSRAIRWRSASSSQS